MKFWRPIIISILSALVLVMSNFLNSSVSTTGFINSFPDVLCPPTLSGLSSQVSLAKKNTPFRYISNKKITMSPIGNSRFSITKDSILIDAAGITPVVWQSRAGNWAGGTICSGPISSQWFTGGTADITSRGKLLVVNSGLSEAIVNVNVWSESGVQAAKVLTIPAKSYSTQGLDALAPGQKTIVLHVSTQAGRVNSFVVDERGKGLNSLGGDLVNSISNPSTHLMIPAIPNQISKDSKGNVTQKGSGHQLRILVPGDVDGHINAEVISADGRYTPVGINDLAVKHGSVSEITLDSNITSNAFALSITSDVPFLASVYSKVKSSGHNDFVWSTPAGALTPMSIAITGLSPVLAFAGESIDISLDVKLSNGKRTTSRITATDFVLWKVPDNASVITITQPGDHVSGGALVSSVNGYGYFPLVAGSTLSKASIPVSNIRVLNP
jgi:hypothetical protein